MSDNTVSHVTFVQQCNNDLLAPYMSGLLTDKMIIALQNLLDYGDLPRLKQDQQVVMQISRPTYCRWMRDTMFLSAFNKVCLINASGAIPAAYDNLVQAVQDGDKQASLMLLRLIFESANLAGEGIVNTHIGQLLPSNS